MSFGHFCHSTEQETLRELIAAVMREKIIVKEIITLTRLVDLAVVIFAVSFAISCKSHAD